MLKIKLTLAAALTALLPSAFAQTAGSYEELHAAIARALPPVIGKDNAELAKKLQSIKIDGAISKNFDSAKVAKSFFGRSTPSSAPDCRSAVTTQGEADEALCELTAGQRDDPTGAFVFMGFNKNPGQGNFKFIKRPAFKPDSTTIPTSVKLTDAAAYENALKFLDLVGVPRSEIGVAPTGAKNPLPVRSLAIGATQEGRANPIVIGKVVSIPRSFAVPGGLFKGPNGEELDRVIAPGGASIVLDDSGVQIAQIDDWADGQIDPKLDARLAKSSDALVDEIAQDLYNEGVRKVGTLSILIGLRKAYPNPDDPNPPLCPVCGVLRPSLKVIISQSPAGKIAVTQGEFAAPGLIREYDLVDQTEPEAPAR